MLVGVSVCVYGVCDPPWWKSEADRDSGVSLQVKSVIRVVGHTYMRTLVLELNEIPTELGIVCITQSFIVNKY